MKDQEKCLDAEWDSFYKRGKYSYSNQKKSAIRTQGENHQIRGYYSNLSLNPNLPRESAMYPSHDHLSFPKDDGEMVIDCRVINDMKSILTETEFWSVIEHIYAVGRSKGKISNKIPVRLNDDWKPSRNFD